MVDAVIVGAVVVVVVVVGCGVMVDVVDGSSIQVTSFKRSANSLNLSTVNTV